MKETVIVSIVAPTMFAPVWMGKLTVSTEWIPSPGVSAPIVKASGVRALSAKTWLAVADWLTSAVT